jgi:hypothetical protein
MNISYRALVPAAFLLVACFPARANAQVPAGQPQQEVRYVTVTRFELPQDTADRRLLMMAIDSFMVPLARMNPNVLSYRVLTHNWGANSNDILIMAEYPTWAAIEADCPACDQWAEAQTPAEGTPERARWNAMGSAFQRAYAGHSDEIYAAQMRRAKQ